MSDRAPSISRLGRRRRDRAEAAPWVGPLRHYDILKEATIAVAIVACLSVLLAVLFSSPDKPPVTLQAWAKAQPVGFTQIALSELDGTSVSANYGPPYNHGRAETQYLGPFSIEKALGVHFPVDPMRSFVLDPLSTLPARPVLQDAIHAWEAAPATERRAWAARYARALDEGRVPSSWPGSGPAPELLSSLLGMARSGALDAQLVSHSSFYTTNYTNPILFLGDSWKAQRTKSYWGEIVTAEHLKSSQWGVMNESGSWPGQPWLWLYTMWYQVPPMSTSQKGNADVLVIAIMAVLSMVLLLVPFIPGLRDIPRRVPLHRAIWRRYYRDQRT